jgi:transcriptional regulator with GAF, ATPase, and Fis domain
MGDSEGAVSISQFKMLTDVAKAAAGSNTRRGLARRVGEALAGHLPVVCFELGWFEDRSAGTATAFLLEPGALAAETTRELRGPEISRIAAAGSARLEVSPAGERIVIVPLASSGNPLGFARISLAANSQDACLSGHVLEVLGGMLAFAQHHCRLVERIAKLSWAAHQESQDLREELRKYSESDKIVARSDAMRRVLESVHRVAVHGTTVLLRGESGTGKELMARRIHQLSKRARQPFVAVNCGALPETLIESELFGHEKGAFTGATARYRGRFERANNGTIFLDEIAELPPSVQVKLLRVLQEGEFERVGGEQSIRVNVRVIAATNQPLEAMMERGAFRADLFYRINVFPIVIPPLRERKEDIPVLARALLAEASKRLGCRLPPLGPKAMAKLLDSAWNGNVRELANTLERALILSQGRELQFDELPALAAPSVSGDEDIAETFDQGARRIIAKALESCRGRIYGKDGAAARLGIPPSTLQGKMRRLRIRPRDFRLSRAQ